MPPRIGGFLLYRLVENAVVAGVPGLEMDTPCVESGGLRIDQCHA